MRYDVSRVTDTSQTNFYINDNVLTPTVRSRLEVEWNVRVYIFRTQACIALKEGNDYPCKMMIT